MTASTPQRRQTDHFGHKLWTGIKRFLMGFGVLALITLITSIVLLRQLGSGSAPEIRDNTVLTYTFQGDLPEVIQRPRLGGPLLQSGTVFHDIIRGLDEGANDPRVKGFIARLKPNSLSISQIQELRDAINRFRQSDKFTYVFADSYGDFTNGMNDYYLASAFDEIWMQPIGTVSITGLNGQMPFFREAMEKIGLSADMYTRTEYKTAAEPLMRDQSSPENREMMQRLLRGLNDQIIAGMAASRDLEFEYVEALINRAPLFDEQALNARLIDHVGYIDQMTEKAEQNAGGKDSARLWEVDFYLHRLLQDRHPRDLKSRFRESDQARKDQKPGDAQNGSTPPPTRVALIYGHGAIMPDDGRNSMSSPILGGDGVLSAEDVAAAINAARLDSRVGAIILRLNTPGGSATASETVARAVARAKDAGKPVIVSMSTAAASGGYWIAAGADHIIAQPSTLTGSIGVVAGKIVLRDLLDKIGVNIENYQYGTNAGMWSSTNMFTPEEREKINELLDHTYEAFLMRVADGRNIPIETLRDTLAGGRVFTGAEALEAGLIDGLGGLDVAYNLAQPLVNPDAPETVMLVQYPPKKSPIEMLIDILVHGATLESPVSVMMQEVKKDVLKILLSGETVSPSLYANLPVVR